MILPIDATTDTAFTPTIKTITQELIWSRCIADAGDCINEWIEHRHRARLTGDTALEILCDQRIEANLEIINEAAAALRKDSK
jgi:hypothetical protein